MTANPIERLRLEAEEWNSLVDRLMSACQTISEFAAGEPMPSPPAKFDTWEGWVRHRRSSDPGCNDRLREQTEALEGRANELREEWAAMSIDQRFDTLRLQIMTLYRQLNDDLASRDERIARQRELDQRRLPRAPAAAVPTFSAVGDPDPVSMGGVQTLRRA